MKRVFMSLAALLCFAAAIQAQSESGRAAIQGSVLDPSGKSIANAEITLRQPETGFVRKGTSNADGEFRAQALPVGEYTIEATAPGFGVARAERVMLLVGETKTVNLPLAVSSVATQVTVVETAELVNSADHSNSVTIDDRAIEGLPIRARTFTEFAQLAPNTTQEANRFGIVVNGQRSINSNVSIDGVDFNDPLQGGARGGAPKESAYFFPQLAVREFQMVLNGASAEVGRTNSGYLNVVTNSGTNSIRGAGFYQNRNPQMTSPLADGTDSANNSQHQFGGSLGGPIKRDKLFYFGAVEKNMVNIPYEVRFDKPAIAVPQNILSQQGVFDQKNNPLVAFGRLDYNLGQKHTVNLQYTYAAQNGMDFGGQSGVTKSASTNNTILDRASQGVKWGLTTVISPALLNEFRGQYVYDNRQQVPVSPLAQVDITDLGTIGGSSNGTYIYEATRNEFLDNLSWTKGIHSIKVGVDINFTPERQQRETNYGGAYTFTSLADYLAAVGGDRTKINSGSNNYQQTLAASGKQGIYKQMQQDHAVFFTDTMRVRRDLTVTAGLRWEGQINPQPPANPAHPINGQIPNDLKMWQPRLGLAWNIAGRNKTVVRLSAGLFDARTPGYLMQRVFTDNGVDTVVLDAQVDKTLINYLTVPNALATLPSGVAVAGNNAVYAFDPGFRNPRSGQLSVAVEQQIDKDTKVTVGFVRNSTWSLQRRMDVNLFRPTVLANGYVAYPSYDSTKMVLVQASGYDPLTGQGIYIDSVTGKSFKPSVARPDTRIGSLNVNKSVGHSSYNGAYISIQRRMSHRVQFGMNYTYAVNRDDDSNERDFNRQYMLNVYDLSRDGAYAKNDIRHNFNTNVLFDLGKGFTLSSLVMAHTGTPGRYVINSDLNNDGNKNNDRPVINGALVSRDSVRLPGFVDWDMRLTKEFKLGERARMVFSIEGYNLTRATNFSFNSDGDSTFGKPTAAVNAATGFSYANSTAGIANVFPGTDRFGGARQAQLGVRFLF
ncbi:MAG: carboxypeptidase regulatory-like domain-containing protein [Bryobacteraceae bacterium]